LKRRPIVALIPLLAAAWLGSRAEAACGEDAVFVQGKTPIHRGPGLNYPVASFLEMGRCMKKSETSADKNWVLVSDGKLLGWVPVDRLDAKSIVETQEEKKPEVGPIGSGQTRGLVTTIKKAALRPSPKAKVKSRRKLPKGTKLLALSITTDRAFVEVRTERGGEVGWVKATSIEDPSGVLAALPISDGKLETGLDTGKQDPVEKRDSIEKKDPVMAGDPPVKDQTDVEPKAEGGTDVDIRILGLAMFPTHSLDSNGLAGIRRYDIAMYTGGLRAEAGLDGLGPLRLRLGYTFLPMPGIKPKGQPGPKIFSHQHDAAIGIGLPIAVGSVRVIPEVGYVFSLFSIRAALPGGPAQFFSTQTHAAAPGLQVQIAISKGFELGIEAAGLVGATLESPFNLGKNGITAGAQGAVSAGIYATNSLMILAQYEVRYLTARFSGAVQLDPTITKASLDTLQHGLSVGVGVLF
jgi:uncharacterized protein YgiM (DUF1202 family)